MPHVVSYFLYRTNAKKEIRRRILWQCKSLLRYFVTFQKVTLALFPFTQISLYTGNGGEKRYHNGNVEEGALLVGEGIVKDSVGEENGCVVELGVSKTTQCTQPLRTS